MQLTAKELAIINVSLRTKPSDREPGKFEARFFPEVDKMKLAIELDDKLQASTKEEGENKMFIDSEVEFSTSLKSFILELLKRPWNVDDSRIYLSLKEKLEQ